MTLKRKHTIVIVDDEKGVTNALRRLFRKDGYQILTATSGQEGLELLKKLEKPVSLIISDQRMPGMNGAQFLERAKKISPDAVRFLLTGYSDMNAIVEAINKGEIHRYLTKPWNDDHLMLQVRQSLEAYELRKEIQEKNEQLRQKDLQLIEMDRIVGIGTLAAGIAHEINNPLGFVKSSIDSLKKRMDKLPGALRYWDDKPISEPLLKDYEDYLTQINFDSLTNSLDTKFDRIQRGIERIMKIVSSLRSFSRLDMETTGKIDINQSIEDAVEVLSTQDAKDVEFVREFQEVPLIECSPNEINQCLLHILKNALDAVDHKGIIKMMTSYNEDKDQTIVRIVDTGKGMSPEVVRQALNPFFTTKAVGSGTGVGLSLTERIIKRHGGMINISSKEGEGTTATITLPVAGELDREQLSTGVVE
jgi:signal transduction histidine kinase